MWIDVKEGKQEILTKLSYDIMRYFHEESLLNKSEDLFMVSDLVESHVGFALDLLEEGLDED